MINAIFLDFNGVIINDEPLQCAAYKDVLREYGIELTDADYYSALGMDDKTFVRAAFERANKKIPQDALPAIMAAKTEHHRRLMGDELPLFPGVTTFLKACARHFSVGLVSMADLDEIHYVLNRSRLLDLFSVIVSADDVTACKPAPDCYRKALDLLNEIRQGQRKLPLLAKECLVIEDSPPGIESGSAVGMQTLGVTNTVSEAQLREAGADVVTPNLADWTTDAVRLVFH